MQNNAPGTAAGAAGAATPHTLPPLPFAYDALEPHISAQVLQFHHDKHHATYVANLNTALAAYPDLRPRSVEDLIAKPEALPEAVRTAIRNNGGGHANHTFYWNCLAKSAGQMPGGELAKAIEKQFESFDKFKDQMSKAAVGVFGSGWGWLCLDEKKQLIIEGTGNQETPLARGHVPLVTIDVWEHAYYLQYQNRRADYVAAIWNVINWEFVTEQFRKGMA